MDSRLPAPPSPAAQTAALTRVSDLIEKALKGELPRDREPHYYEPSILSPAHINMVLDRTAGMTLKEIAERWDYTPAQVGNVLGHPDAQRMISTILSLQTNALVSMEERFKNLAPEALNTKVDIMRDTNVHAGIRNTVASDILDRAGYMPRKQVDVKQTTTILMPAQAATGLREIMEESRRVSTVDYSNFLQKAGAEGSKEHLQLEAGHQEFANGASPVPTPVLVEEREDEARVA